MIIYWWVHLPWEVSQLQAGAVNCPPAAHAGRRDVLKNIDGNISMQLKWLKYGLSEFTALEWHNCPWMHLDSNTSLQPVCLPQCLTLPSSCRYFLSFLAVLNDRVAGSGFSKTSSSSSLSCCGTVESVFSSNCVTLCLNGSPTTNDDAMVLIGDSHVYLQPDMVNRLKRKRWNNLKMF